MTINARMTQADPRLYNVNRDLAHNFEFVITTLAECLETNRWPVLDELAKAHNITQEQLGQACAALIRFVLGQTDNPKDTMSRCLERSGFLDLPPYARVIMMAYLGNITLGMHFNGVKETTINGQGPVQSYRELAQAGDDCVRLMGMSKLRRRWTRFKRRMFRLWND